MYQQARRGRENIRTMTKDAFKIATDDRQFIYQHVDEGDKNHGVTDVKIANEGRIYENKGELHTHVPPPLSKWKFTLSGNFCQQKLYLFQRVSCALSLPLKLTLANWIRKIMGCGKDLGKVWNQQTNGGTTTKFWVMCPSMSSWNRYQKTSLCHRFIQITAPEQLQLQVCEQIKKNWT